MAKFIDIKVLLLEDPSISQSAVDTLLDNDLTALEQRNLLNDLLSAVGFSQIRVQPSELDRLIQEVNSLYGATASNQQENSTVGIRKTTFVNGVDVEDLNMEGFLSAIKKHDSEIKRLTDLNVDSAAVKKQIDTLTSERATMVELLDEKYANDDSADS